jgi:hypothetical protein
MAGRLATHVMEKEFGRISQPTIVSERLALLLRRWSARRSRADA